MLTATLLILVSLLLAAVFGGLAHRVDLVDHPGGRKDHEKVTPLVGGIAIFVTFLLGGIFLDIDTAHWFPLALGGGLLLVVGVVDDYRGLSAGQRFLAQIAATLIIFYLGDVGLGSLGKLVDEQPLLLGVAALPFTVFCVVGVINATNMLDGLDGLAGGLLLVFFGILLILAINAGLQEESQVLMIICAALAGFLLLNFRWRHHRPARIFMGDAGSLFLGLAVAWFLMKLTQEPIELVKPITAVWLFALPIMDTVAIMVRRVMKGRSPFAPDREHFHHILLLAGFKVRTTVIIILVLSLVLAGVGLYGEYAGVPQFVMFYLFLGLFAVYFWGMLHAWKVMKMLHKLHDMAEGDTALPKGQRNV